MPNQSKGPDTRPGAGNSPPGAGNSPPTPGSRSDVLSHPESWKTGDEPATTAQRGYLETLCREANEHYDPDAPLTKADAARRIEELQQKTGRRGAAGDHPLL